MKTNKIKDERIIQLNNKIQSEAFILIISIFSTIYFYKSIYARYGSTRIFNRVDCYDYFASVYFNQRSNGRIQLNGELIFEKEIQSNFYSAVSNFDYHF